MNSTKTLGGVVSYAKSFAEIAPVIQNTVGGVSLQPALTIADDVMTEMLSQSFNPKWNSFNLPLFYTNSFQQDYALNVVNLGWLENGTMTDINNTATPKPIYPLETVRYLPATSNQVGRPGQVCWIYNNQMRYGVWTPNTTFGPLVGVSVTPANPLLQIVDPNGNFWTVTTFGTTGATQPIWPTALTYPTQTAPTATATTVTDGTVVWTALNPSGQGIRCNPLPPQAGVVYQFNVVGQYRPGAFNNGGFTQFSQTLEPIPDDYAKYFRDGFVVHCYAHSSEAKVRGKFQDLYNMWLKALHDSAVQGDRERDDAGFYPSVGLMDAPWTLYPGPAYPFPAS